MQRPGPRPQGPGARAGSLLLLPRGSPQPSPLPPVQLSAAFRVLFPPLTQPGEGRAGGTAARPGTASRSCWGESRRVGGVCGGGRGGGQTVSGLEGPPQAELIREASPWASLPIHSFGCSTDIGWPPFLLHSIFTKYLLCILSVPSSRNYVSGAYCVQSPVLVGPIGPHFENHPSRPRCQLPSLTRCAETW